LQSLVRSLKVKLQLQNSCAYLSSCTFTPQRYI
jgi:hypothetical protein